MSNYIHKCELCGKLFDLYNGEGWGESYDAGGMLPKTRYVCTECIKSRKEIKKMDTAQYNRGWRDGATHMLDSVLDFMGDLPETPEVYKVKEFIRNLEEGD